MVTYELVICECGWEHTFVTLTRRLSSVSIRDRYWETSLVGLEGPVLYETTAKIETRRKLLVFDTKEKPNVESGRAARLLRKKAG